MKKYPSIEQFRHVIKTVRSKHDFKGKDEDGKSIYIHTEPYPTLKFLGTIKLHGTNASIVKYADGRIEYQSRERILTLENDNASFMNEMSQKDLTFLFSNIQYQDFVAIYGEWCGGNIQKGVAITGLPKMFVIFGIMVDDRWIELPRNLYDESQRIYNILQFKTYEVDIDFNNPELIQNDLIEKTIEVETCCPVGEYFGREGIGEGIVFTSVTDYDLKFKSKGEKHSVSKVKTLNSIDVESLQNINEFVDVVVTENRLLQGISKLREDNQDLELKSLGSFLSWIVLDIFKEENDTIKKNSFDEKKLKSAIVAKSRMWYLSKLNTLQQK